MGKEEKLLERIKRNPKNVRFNDLCKVLKNKGYKNINTRGSHYSFSNNTKTITIIRPHSGKKFCNSLDVKEVIKQCLQ